MMASVKAFTASHVACKPVSAVRVQRTHTVTVEASRVCDLTGKKVNKANVVTFSNKHIRKWQQPNLQHKRVWWENGQRWVSLKICTKAIKTIEKNGLDKMAIEAGIDLWKLPYTDGRKARREYLAQNPGRVPRAKNPRAMKNPIKLANSKLPKIPVYDESGRIMFVAASSVEEALQKQQEDLEVGAPALKITVSE
jgi:large subunit ribosomal protein L28